MEYYKFKVDEAKLKEIQDFYGAELINSPKRPYDIFETKTIDNVTIKAYKSKQLYTILFAGEEPQVKYEAQIFFKQVEPIKKNIYTADGSWEDSFDQIGSDEVGVGDFFLGFYVCAVFLDHKDVEFIDSLGVRDSKKLTDSKIEEIGPTLVKNIRKHVVNLSPNKLMTLKEKNFSTHVMLAKAHAFCHQQLLDKYHIKASIPIYIDQFEAEKNYIKYAKPTFQNNMVFTTKGESYYPSIATASVIARYCFLEDWKKMEEHFGVTIPKGASAQVDKVYLNLLKKYGQEELDPYVKRFFRNYNK